MSDRIRLLPEIVANQIAAGEVVNCPASVVKEMMENALDAGARSVTVNFREGGRDLIQIVDDGCGMSPIDARMAFDRHATSKIASVDDIYALHTFGFRGEALASIAAVAQVELRTRQNDDETGTLTTIHGGKFVSQEPVMCPVGSQFMVRNLFYNVPARRKFMEQPRESQRQIRSEFNRVALCYPDVRFELYENDMPVLILEPSSLAGRIVDVVGKTMKHNLLEVSVDTSIVRIAGFVGRPDAAMSGSYKRKDAVRYLFVNGRYFKSPYLYSAILKAYDRLIPEGTTPSYFLYLTVSPERVDVNVHPQKIEVKFSDEDAVWSILNAAVRETLAKTGAVPMMSFSDEDASVEIPVARRGAVYGEPKSNSDDSYNPFREGYTDDGGASPRRTSTGGGMRGGRVADDSLGYGFDPAAEGLETIPSTEFDVIPSAGFDADDESSLEFIPSQSAEQMTIAGEDEGAAFDCVTSVGGGYAVAMYGGRCVVADMRRVCERLIYDDCMAMLRSGSAVSQQLLFPERLTLTNGDYALIEQHAVDFASLGFDIEYSGGGTIEVKGTPADMPADRIDELVYELLRALDTPQTAAEIRRERVAAVMARNGARSLPRMLKHDEAAAMLGRLAATGNVGFTPSGHAIMTQLTAEDFRQLLDR